jgi:hypothetical protein
MILAPIQGMQFGSLEELHYPKHRAESVVRTAWPESQSSNLIFWRFGPTPMLEESGLASFLAVQKRKYVRSSASRKRRHFEVLTRDIWEIAFLCKFARRAFAPLLLVFSSLLPQILKGKVWTAKLSDIAVDRIHNNQSISMKNSKTGRIYDTAYLTLAAHWLLRLTLCGGWSLSIISMDLLV